MLFLQFLLNGILIGGLYALLALGIVLICKATRVFNFALGEMLALGAFILYTFLTTLHLPLWLALPGSVLIIAAAGLAMERLALRTLIGQPILAAIMATLALSLMLRGLVLFYWRAPPSSVFRRSYCPRGRADGIELLVAAVA